MANRLVEILVQVKDGATIVFSRLKESIKGVGDAVISMKGLIIGAVTGAVVTGIEKLVEAFAEEEKVVTRLNAALRVSGRFTQEGSDAIQAMAEKMLETTTHSRDEALGVSATFASLARELTTTQLAQAQQLAIGLADATGKSVEGASLMIVRSLTGQGNALKRWGVDLDTAGTQQEKFNQIQSKLGPLFQISRDEANTLAGHIAQTKNQFHALQVTVGEVIARFLGINEKTSALRDTFKRWREEIGLHGGEWIRYGQAVIASFTVITRAINALITILVGVLHVAFVTFVESVAIIISGAVLALDAAWEAIAFAVKAGINKAIIDPLNAMLTLADGIAHKFGKSISFRIGEIDTTNPFQNTKRDAAELAGHVANIGAEWSDQFAIAKDSVQSVGDALNNVGKILDRNAGKLPGVHNAGAGANVGTASDEGSEEKLRGLLEEQKLLDAEYKAGAISLETYRRRLGEVRDGLESLRDPLGGNARGVAALFAEQARLSEAWRRAPGELLAYADGSDRARAALAAMPGLTDAARATTLRLFDAQRDLDNQRGEGSIQADDYRRKTAAIRAELLALAGPLAGNRAATIQLYDALAKIQDVKVTQLIDQAERLKEAFHNGSMTTKEYDSAMAALIKDMEKLLRAAGMTEEQIKKITHALTEGRESLKGIGPQITKAFGLGPGQGGEALANANKAVADMALGLGEAFANAVGQAIAAGGSFGKVIQAAVGQAAKSFAGLAIGRSLMEVAEGIAASLVPGKQAEATAHFTAAKVFGAAAVLMGGLGAAVGGGGHGGGHGAGAAAANASAGKADQKGSGTIVVQGGLLDMSDPRQADAFGKAVSDLTGRNVIVQAGSGG